MSQFILWTPGMYYDLSDRAVKPNINYRCGHRIEKKKLINVNFFPEQVKDLDYSERTKKKQPTKNQLTN